MGKTLVLKQTMQGFVKVNNEKQKAVAKARPAHCCYNCKYAEIIGGEEVKCPKCIDEYTYIGFVCRLFRFRY